MNLVKLREQLSILFDKRELHNLCFDLSVNYEELPGDTVGDIARELVRYCDRHGRIHQLLKRCRKVRPNVDWPDISSTEEAISESNNRTDLQVNNIVPLINRPSADVLFSNTDNLPSFNTIMSNHDEIWMSAKDLHSFISTYKAEIQEAARIGKRFRFLIVNPDEPALMGALAASSYLYSDSLTRESKKVIDWLKKMVDDAKGNIMAGLTNCIPANALMIADGKEPRGQMIVSMYGYKVPRNKRLHVHLIRAKDSQTFDFYLFQFERMWQDATLLTN